MQSPTATSLPDGFLVFCSQEDNFSNKNPKFSARYARCRVTPVSSIVSSVTVLSITSKIFARYARFHFQFYLAVMHPISNILDLFNIKDSTNSVLVIQKKHENEKLRSSNLFFLSF